ncbi:MAG: hypothetical protein ASUL_01170 [Candidatus Aramenus sulfurataquae]|jgi:uncharacterized membrane protein YoaK (UPF0700 family)|uniref:Uncharacterized protein n=2 Tax=Candidatus Aramenus sulfurataquae TaxID=1326980 RepID=W7KZI7_9CREN|nr:MAG: hypothetical protein ASUL_01170 [Candidatus Aramenus sulfurataquae]MCL7344355.1 hypothetical protein [Candidatus Aramenus sulfurataquae]
MFELWYIHIALSVISAIFASLILVEFSRLRRELKGKISLVLVVISVLLVLVSVTDTVAFSLWSSDRNPIYVYPSLGMAILTASVVILLYYYVTRV